jgi:hypothetical protein
MADVITSKAFIVFLCEHPGCLIESDSLGPKKICLDFSFLHVILLKDAVFQRKTTVWWSAVMSHTIHLKYMTSSSFIKKSVV